MSVIQCMTEYNFYTAFRYWQQNDRYRHRCLACV